MMSFQDEMETIRSLINNRDDIINRTVEATPQGIRARTFSSGEPVAMWIKQHVAEMRQNVERHEPPIRLIPLSTRCFNTYADEMRMTITEGQDGVTVESSGATPCAVAIAKAHGEAGCIKTGFEGMWETYEIPKECDA